MQIKELHRIVIDNLIDHKGEFKTIPNLIVGADFETTKLYASISYPLSQRALE